MSPTSTRDELLGQLCRDLRRLREQAGGPSVRTLAGRVGLGKSQVDAILNGRIRRAPDWRVVRGLVEAFYAFARDRERLNHLSIRAGLEEYWRPRHAMVEHACGRGIQEQSGQAQSAHEQSTHEPDAAGAGAAVVPRQLPPVAPQFVGRKAELARLVRIAELHRAGESGGGVGPLLVTGMAGVGKTTLAVAWAHRVAPRFPDGQLYLNLRGFDPSRPAMSPAQAVGVLLEALGARVLPPGLEAQVGLYRSLLAGRRVLVLLDDARDADQVRALLPASSACRLLVTSRVELTGLIATDGAHPVALDVLSEVDATRMLAERLGRGRVEAEPEAVRRLVAVCGRLPIALAIVAARATTRPDFPLSAIADEAGWAFGRVGAAPVGYPRPDVWAVFSWSYRALSPPAARLFRLLGLHPGPDISGRAVASLAGTDEGTVGPLLAELAGTHLITEPGPGRYGFHDLLRAYALERAGQEETGAERVAARRRCLDHYVLTGIAAAMLISPHRSPIAMGAAGPGVLAEPLDHRDEAARWFAAERAVLVAAAELAATAGFDAHTWKLGWLAADFLELRGHFDDWIAMQGHAEAAARRLGDPLILGRILLIVGSAYARAGRPVEALAPYEEAAGLFGDLGELAWQARAVNCVGGLFDRQGRYREAMAYARRSLQLYQASGDPEGVARSHNSIGWCHCQLGEFRPAIAHCRQALEYYQRSGAHNGQAATWDTIGYAHHGLGEFDEAAAGFRRALALVRDLGDRYNEAGILHRLGRTLAGAGDWAAARGSWRQAAAIYDELGHPEAAAVRAELAAGPGEDPDPGGASP